MPPTMGGPPPENGRGKKKRKRQRGLLGTCVSAVFWVFAISALILALPLFLGCDPWDAQYFVDAHGYDMRGTLEAKIDALRDGIWHKKELSRVKFSHDGKSVTLVDKAGELSAVTAEGYAYDESAEAADDWNEARRILKEWGIG